MNVHNLNAFFKPRRIALIGVSPNPKSVSGMVLSNLVGSGFRGVVYPINPDAEAVMGIPCYDSLESLPHKPDLGIVCTAAEQVPAWVKACGESGILAVLIMSAGFKEAGEAGKVLEAEILAIKKQYDGMRIIGPNCLGVIAPHQNLNASFAGAMPKKGHVAFISQSGALCTSVLDWAAAGNIGFSHFVSIGNTLDVDFGDLIDYFGEDEETQSIILYVESISQARKFMTAARAFARNLPIIVYKAGRFPESAAVAASHTGAMASEDAVYDAAFQRAGLARVYDIGEIFACAELIGRRKIPKGARLGIVTNAGGPGVMATDALIAMGGRLAELSDETLARLDENLPAMWSHGNPVDVLGDARSKRMAKAVRFVLDDKNVDALLVILTPQAMTNPTAMAKAIGELAEKSSKPILAAWLGGVSMREGIQILGENGVAAYVTPEAAVGAFMTLVAYARNLEALYETPKDVPVSFTLDKAEIRKEFEQLTQGGQNMMSESDSKRFLEAFGIETTLPRFAASADEAVTAARAVGYPVVMKIESPDISHKSDAGGVMLNLEDDASVKDAFDLIMANAGKYQPDADLKGVTLQPMVQMKEGVELILGLKKDAVFGTVLLAGMGGVTAELMGDRTLGLPPLNEKLALRMLKSLKIWPLLAGYRGKTPVNVDKLVEVMIRLSYLAAEYPEITELDINPLWVSPQGVMALDARIAVEPSLTGQAGIPYAHLALRPYPEKFVSEAALSDGRPVLLRPIKPEDEPLWFELLGACSKESLYMRFRYLFHWETHEVASRYCFIDYDREVAIVAEVEVGGERKLLGVGRLVADPDLDTAEYAILIADAWQNQGLGGLLTDYCLDIAKGWGVKRMVAQTTSDNGRMVQVFKSRGFTVEPDASTAQVMVEREL